MKKTLIAVIRAHGTNYKTTRIDRDYATKKDYAHDCRANGYYVCHILTVDELRKVQSDYKNRTRLSCEEVIKLFRKYGEETLEILSDVVISEEPEQATHETAPEEEYKRAETPSLQDVFGNQAEGNQTTEQAEDTAEQQAEEQATAETETAQVAETELEQNADRKEERTMKSKYTAVIYKNGKQVDGNNFETMGDLKEYITKGRKQTFTVDVYEITESGELGDRVEILEVVNSGIVSHSEAEEIKQEHAETYEHAVEMASTKPNWFKDVFLPSLLARTEPLNQLWLTQKQTAVCARNMKQSVTRDDYGEHISYHTEWDGRTVEMLYSKKNQCGSIRFSRNAEEQAEADKKAMQEIKSQESERFRNRVEAIQSGNQRAISGTIREFRRLKENLESMQEDIADGFYDETESCYIQCKQEFDFFSAIVEKTGIQV